MTLIFLVMTDNLQKCMAGIVNYKNRTEVDYLPRELKKVEIL